MCLTAIRVAPAEIYELEDGDMSSTSARLRLGIDGTCLLVKRHDDSHQCKAWQTHIERWELHAGRWSREANSACCCWEICSIRERSRLQRGFRDSGWRKQIEARRSQRINLEGGLWSRVWSYPPTELDDV